MVNSNNKSFKRVGLFIRRINNYLEAELGRSRRPLMPLLNLRWTWVGSVGKCESAWETCFNHNTLGVVYCGQMQIKREKDQKYE